MTRTAIAALCAALALVTFYQFPGHTWLQQDSQIYVPILENRYHPAVLRQDLLVQHPHVAFTLYDEAALGLRKLTGLGFREVLAFQQIVTRGLGIAGFYLMALAAGLGVWPALTAAAICSLGAIITGPSVLTFEYEPTPRAFAVPLLICAIGLAAHRRYWAASIAASAAVLYHAPTTLPFWAVFVPLLVWRRQFRPLIPLAASLAIVFLSARWQGGSQDFFSRLTPAAEQLQRMRAAYVWVSTWRWEVIAHHLLVCAMAMAAYARMRRDLSADLRWFVLGLPILGILSLPVSWIALEQAKWALAPQIQPLRAVLFGTVVMLFLAAAAGLRSPRWGAGWLALAFLLPLQPLLTGPYDWRRLSVCAALAIGTAFTGRWAPAVALAAFLAVPLAGGVTNYPRLHTPDLAELSGWARSHTPADAVFLFPDIGRGLDPGIFRSEALRAVYVDWKAGGQINYIPGFDALWWPRWQQTMTAPVEAQRLAAFGIHYIVLRKPRETLNAPSFQNASYTVYQIRVP